MCGERGGGLGGGEMTSCVAIGLLQDSGDRVKLTVCRVPNRSPGRMGGHFDEHSQMDPT